MNLLLDNDEAEEVKMALKEFIDSHDAPGKQWCKDAEPKMGVDVFCTQARNVIDLRRRTGIDIPYIPCRARCVSSLTTGERLVRLIYLDYCVFVLADSFTNLVPSLAADIAEAKRTRTYLGEEGPR